MHFIRWYVCDVCATSAALYAFQTCFQTNVNETMQKKYKVAQLDSDEYV